MHDNTTTGSPIARRINPEAASEFLATLGSKISAREHLLAGETKIILAKTLVKTPVMAGPRRDMWSKQEMILDLLREAQADYQKAYEILSGETLREAQMEQAGRMIRAAQLFDAALTEELDEADCE